MKKTLPQLKTVMTPFPYSLDVDADVASARALLMEHGFHHLPLTEHGRLVGMVSSGRLAASEGRALRDLCGESPYVVDIDTRLAEVLATLAARRVDAAVVTRHDKLVGVFTVSDACRAFAALLESLDPPPGEDLVA
ncbi:MAG: CBS domain-containing protein [Gammaproteobacteria bacterium]|nr:CBS domain-containing protein [Gammaproteobacteria bacterium]